LLTNLILKVGGKYVLSSNIEVSDGLTNGTPWVLKQVVWGQLQTDKSLVPLRLYMEYEEISIGDNMRQRLKEKILHDIVGVNWTPIERVDKFMQIAQGAIGKISRNQCPIKPAFAMTIHTSQGTTQNKVLVKLRGLDRRLKYTALSRVRSLQDLFIDGVFESPRRNDLNKDPVCNEINRMREYSPYQFKLTYSERDSKNIQVVFQNIRSLMKYLPYIVRFKLL